MKVIEANSHIQKNNENLNLLSMYVQSFERLQREHPTKRAQRLPQMLR